MPKLEFYIDLKIDGERAEHLGFPLQFTTTREEIQQFNYLEANDVDLNTFSQIPVDQITTVRDFLIHSVDQATGVRLEGGETGGEAKRLAINGLVLIINDNGVAFANLTINNNSGANARIRGLGAG